MNDIFIVDNGIRCHEFDTLYKAELYAHRFANESGSSCIIYRNQVGELNLISTIGPSDWAANLL